jgi:glucose-6-phosphate isomerase
MLTYAGVCCRSAQVLGGIGDLSKTLVLVASKSGGTLETLTNEKMVRNYLRAHAKEKKRLGRLRNVTAPPHTHLR